MLVITLTKRDTIHMTGGVTLRLNDSCPLSNVSLVLDVPDEVRVVRGNALKPGDLAAMDTVPVRRDMAANYKS